MGDEDKSLRALGELSMEAFEEAIAGSRQVLDHGTGWSTVSQRRIIAMASVIALFDPERSIAEPDGQEP